MPSILSSTPDIHAGHLSGLVAVHLHSQPFVRSKNLRPKKYPASCISRTLRLPFTSFDLLHWKPPIAYSTRSTSWQRVSISIDDPRARTLLKNPSPLQLSRPFAQTFSWPCRTPKQLSLPAEPAPFRTLVVCTLAASATRSSPADRALALEATPVNLSSNPF